MSIWQHREGAARLMVWLLFKTQFNRNYPLDVQTLMEVAYGEEKVQLARQNSEFRKKLTATWDEDLLTLHERGWLIQFDPDTYPLEIRPSGFGRDNFRKPRGFFNQLLAARLLITPEESLINEVAIVESKTEANQPPFVELHSQPTLTGNQVKALRTAKGWSQRKLATFTGMSQGLISLIENEERAISPDNEEVLKRVFELSP